MATVVVAIVMIRGGRDQYSSGRCGVDDDRKVSSGTCH